MESSLILAARWPFSPFATALAAGALFAFCLTLLKRQKPPKRRHSAPARLEDLPRDPEGASNLYRTASEGFLNRTETGTPAFRRLTSTPSISNFPAFDGRVTLPSPFHLSRFPFPERPFTFSDDLINIEKQFQNLYDFPLGRHGRGKRRGYSSLPNFGIVSGLGNPPFPGFIPLSRHLSPFRSSGSLARRWKSISFELDRKRSPSPSLRTPEKKRKFAFYSDSVLLPGTLSFRKKCYSTAFEFSRFRATFCASIHGVCSRSMIDSPEPRSNLLSVPGLSVRKSESIPIELSRLDEVCDTNGIENGNVSMHRKENDFSDISSSVNLETEERYEFSVLLREVNCSPYDLSSDLDAEKSLDMIESGDESSFSQTERIDSSPSSKSKANKRPDVVELNDEDSLDATEKSESSFIGSSELESVILKDEAYETVESESLDQPLGGDEPEHKVLCGSVPSTATNGAVSKVDSASLANKTGVNASGLRRRKTTGGAQLEKIERSRDEQVKEVTAEGKLFSPAKDASAEYNKEEDASEYESLKSDREGKTLEDNSTTDSYYSILEKSENLLRKDSTEDEIDSSADFLTPISESANNKVLYESLGESLEEEFPNEKIFEVRSDEKRDCDNESANVVLFQNEEIGDEVENSIERTRLKSLGSEETLVSDEEMVRKSADEKEVLSRAVRKKEFFTPSAKKEGMQCLSKDEKVKIQEFSIYENGHQVLYEAVENNVAVKICSNSLEGKGARQKTPKSGEKTAGEERSISNTTKEKTKPRSFGDTAQAPVVVSIGPGGRVDLSVRRAIEGRLACFQGCDNAKREPPPIERRDVTRSGESGQMERALAPERTRPQSDVRLRVVSDVWTTEDDVTVVVQQDVWRGGGMDWREDDSFDVLTADFHPVATPERADEFRPTFEEFMPEEGGGGDLNAAIRELEGMGGGESSPRRVNRLLGLLKRDDERRKRPPPEEDGEWDRILGDLLRSVSELESARRRLDCSAATEGAASSTPAPAAPPHSAMDGAGETPTKVKSLRFKLDPDVFDVPADDSFYEEDSDEPVRLVSVHASVVPAGQKSVARPVGIDLRVRLTDSSKRSHGGTTPPAQAKRRSPVADPRSLGWCQELSPVTENVDWRETFTPVTHREAPKTPEQPPKPVPNGILKTPSPKVENAKVDAANPFKGEMTNGHSTKPSLEKPALPPKPPVTNGFHAPKKLSLPRKKFVPDPEAIERITGYKNALTKPPIPPAIPAKPTPPLTRLNRAEIARKQYLDNRAHLSSNRTIGGDSSTRKFQQFLTQAQTDRARIVTSVPDLNAIEKAVSEKWAKERGGARVSPAKEDEDERYQRGVSSSRGSTPDDQWASYVQSFRKSVGGRRSQSLSYLETDVDLLVTDEEEDKWRSSSALDSGEEEEHPEDSDLGEELADDSGRARSEHELRIQRSLQSLPLPDWYKRSDKQKSGFILKSSAEKEKRGWAAAKSLASSTSSLASCGLRRPVRSLRSSRENIPWSKGSPDGPALSLALAKAFREPYLGWRARTSTTSSGVSSSSRTSPCGGGTDASLDVSVVATSDVSFDGEDAFGRTTSSSPTGGVHPDDTGADVVTVSMDTEGDSPKPPTAEDTCEDIHNMSMDTFEEATTLDNLSSSDNATTDTSKQEQQVKEVSNPKRYSYSQSIYHSEWEDGEESRGEKVHKERTVQEEEEEDPSSPDHNKVIWIESSFVGSRTTTSIVVLPEDQKGNQLERPASR